MKKIFALLFALLICNIWSGRVVASELINLPEISDLKANGAITTAVFSPDDKFIVTGDSNGYITVFNAATGALVNEWKDENRYSISKLLFSPDGQRIVSIGRDFDESKIKVWDAQTGTLLSTLVLDKYGNKVVKDITFNKDGTVLYSVDDSGDVIYWDVFRGEKIIEFTTPSIPVSLAYNADKKHLAIGQENGSINIRHSETGEYITNKLVNKDSSWSSTKVKYSADNNTLFFSETSYSSQPHLFDVDNNYQEVVLEENDYSGDWKNFDFHSSNKYIAVVGEYDYLQVFDMETKKLIAQEAINSNYDYVVFSHNGKRLIVNGTIYDTTVLFNKLTSIQLTPSSLYMSVDDTQGFKVTGKYSDGSEKAIPSTEIQWSSSDPEVVTFMYGKFQALKPGKATVTASYKGFTATAVIQVNAQQFTDLEPIHLDAVNYLVGRKITGGLSNTIFGTNETIKRVDAAIMIAKALELNIASAPKSGFIDVPQRGQAYVNVLKVKGIIGGKTKTIFGSNDQITRGEMALILQRAYKLTPGSTKHPFIDVTSRYEDAVSSLMRYKIATGINSYQFGTSIPITRGDFAIFLYNSEIR
ncbi:S-layer homology domain-containing protein [Bacillus sp. FJAT-42315]|uniref:S-layer homology domain-containing protein n=1 Tax=Bacillus sp. FJAT-42315 TaxID=2014077 RepID=UPI000C238AF3|nr:S-layer homology domain-containing protein [Bacillus sp. FJAT-42315]